VSIVKIDLPERQLRRTGAHVRAACERMRMHAGVALRPSLARGGRSPRLAARSGRLAASAQGEEREREREMHQQAAEASSYDPCWARNHSPHVCVPRTHAYTSSLKLETRFPLPELPESFNGVDPEGPTQTRSMCETRSAPHSGATGRGHYRHASRCCQAPLLCCDIPLALAHGQSGRSSPRTAGANLHASSNVGRCALGLLVDGSLDLLARRGEGPGVGLAARVGAGGGVARQSQVL
jgi:hypothetical protein